MSDTESSILCDMPEPGIAIVTINKPERRNALDLDMWRQLEQTMTRLSDDDAMRCIIVRGAGEKAFAAGADIVEFQRERRDKADAIAYGDVVASSLRAVAECRHPTIAMIFGACTGGGLELACGCDMRISGESGRFGVPINRIGHAFAYPEAELVMRLVGRPIILEMLYEGRIMQSDEALRRGLLNRIVADAELEAHVIETAQRIAAGAPLGARMSKAITRRLLDAAPYTREELEAGYDPCDSEDYREGMMAFAEKRDPVFHGR